MVGILFSHQIKNQKGSIVNGSSFSNANDGASIRLEDGLRNLRREDRTIPFLASIATTPVFFLHIQFIAKNSLSMVFLWVRYFMVVQLIAYHYSVKSIHNDFNSYYWVSDTSVLF